MHHEKLERDRFAASSFRHGLRCGVNRAPVAHDEEGAITVKRDLDGLVWLSTDVLTSEI